MSWEEAIIGPQLVGVIFMLAGWLQLKYPPEKINGLYGYRTQLSMKNQHNWDEGNRFSAKLLAWVGFWLVIAGYFITGVLLLFKNKEIRLALNIPLLILSAVTTVIILFNKTERHLERFEQENQ